MKTLFFSILFIENFFLSTPIASEYSKEEFEHQILTTNDTVTRLRSVAFSAVSGPLTLHTRQDDLSIAQDTLKSLLDDYATLTGEHFILPTETSPVDSTLSEISIVLSVSPTDTSSSEQYQEDLEEQILATQANYDRLLRMTFPSTENPSMFKSNQENLSTVQNILISLLDDYFALTGEHFILSTESRTTPEPTEGLTSEDSTSDTFTSEQFKEVLELTHEILTIYNDVIKLAAIRTPLNADPSKFKEGQEDLSIAQSILANLLEDYFTLTGEHFILPTESRTIPEPTEEATVYTPPIDTLQINTSVHYNGFRTIYVGRNKGNISIESLLKEAQQNCLLPVRFADPDKNLCQLELVKPNKTPAKPAEQSSAM
ncbi:hypothetical protein [Candidatus Bodocaedibacter vickermanii]|uniref:Uncharacterized protein n=1 Tax=Candidatus Bodocaedibacter vickermanii TaxID=2741701 RepID=A0A7L9RVB5_9PROT|nr:hypothetical protein CPBP_01077 [Candidatus Paracaedibacteraceae bacterium 'Lake Konstanz']